MSSADSRTRHTRERSDRRVDPPAPEPPGKPRPPREPNAAEDNGQAEPEGPLGAEIFGDDQDPFEHFGDEQQRQLEEGSFEYTLHSTPASRKAEHHAPRRVATPEGRQVDPGDTDIEEAPVTPEEVQRETERWAPRKISDTVLDTGVEKVCRVCGKNLRGHRRYKDEKGYICPDCDRLERAKRIACAECGKPVPPESLKPWGPISICTRCWADHESDPKMRIKRRVSSRPWEEMEKKTVLIISGVVAVVLLILFLISML